MLLVAGLAASCTAGASGTETLVSRDLELDDVVVYCDLARCTSVSSGNTYRDHDGDIVVSSGSRVSFRLEQGDEPEVVCGSEVFVRAFVSRTSDYAVDVPVVLTFEDGSVVRLLPERGFSAGFECIEQAGRWEGTAGSYLGRTGEFLLVSDRLQATLTLDGSSP
jgi:hypothetical protein